MSLHRPHRYQIPTHLGTPDKLDLPLFGITVSLTLRQGVCFLLGGSLIFHLWEQSFALVGVGGWLVHWGVPCMLAFVTYVFAVQEIRGRHLEEWMLVWWRYSRLIKVFVWRSVILDEPLVSQEEPEPSGTMDQQAREEDEAA